MGGWLNVGWLFWQVGNVVVVAMLAVKITRRDWEWVIRLAGMLVVSAAFWLMFVRRLFAHSASTLAEEPIVGVLSAMYGAILLWVAWSSYRD
jgi:hypothetical protein